MEVQDKKEDKKIVLSGIRATGNLHLGNYYGALNKFVRMQDDYDTRYFIADLHALTYIYKQLRMKRSAILTQDLQNQKIFTMDLCLAC